MPDKLTTELGEPPNRIAVVRALQLGDVLVATPALRALRMAFSSARITLIGLPWARSFVHRNCHLLDDYLEFPGFPNLPEREFDANHWPQFLERARHSRFDIAFQLHGSGQILNPIVAQLGARRTAGFYTPGFLCPDPVLYQEYPQSGAEIRRNLSLMRFLRIPLQGEAIDFRLSEIDFAEAKALRNTYGLENYVCLHAGARYRTRRWPAECFAAVGDALAAKGFAVALTGSLDEAGLVARVSCAMRRRHANLAGKTTLGGLAALIQSARLLITNDTGVSHVGSGVGVRSVVIVMGSDPQRWAPLDRERHTVVFDPIDCRPCGHDVCPIGHPCATRVTVASVLAAAHQQLDQPDIRHATELTNDDSPVAAFA